VADAAPAVLAYASDMTAFCLARRLTWLLLANAMTRAAYWRGCDAGGDICGTSFALRGCMRDERRHSTLPIAIAYATFPAAATFFLLRRLRCRLPAPPANSLTSWYSGWRRDLRRLFAYRAAPLKPLAVLVLYGFLCALMRRTYAMDCSALNKSLPQPSSCGRRRAIAWPHTRLWTVFQGLRYGFAKACTRGHAAAAAPRDVCGVSSWRKEGIIRTPAAAGLPSAVRTGRIMAVPHPYSAPGRNGWR